MKSVYVIGGIGGVGCLLLSFMMQHLLKVQSDQGAGQVTTELEELSSGHLVGKPEVRIQETRGTRTLVARMRTRTGVDRLKYAIGTGRLLWRTAYAMRTPPARMRFEVGDEQGAPPVVVEIPPPGAPMEMRRSAGSDLPPTPPADGRR